MRSYFRRHGSVPSGSGGDPDDLYLRFLDKPFCPAILDGKQTVYKTEDRIKGGGRSLWTLWDRLNYGF
jgi:hypothetical protein